MFAGTGCADDKRRTLFDFAADADDIDLRVGDGATDVLLVGHAEAIGPLAVECAQLGIDVGIVRYGDDAQARMVLEERDEVLLVAVLGKADEDDAVGRGGHGKMGRCFFNVSNSKCGCRWILLVIYRANVLGAWDACQALVLYRY